MIPNYCDHGFSAPLACPKCNPPPSWPWPDPTNAEIAALKAALAAAEAEVAGLRMEHALDGDSLKEMAADRAAWIARAERAEAEVERQKYLWESIRDARVTAAEAQRDALAKALRGVVTSVERAEWCWCGDLWPPFEHTSYCLAARAALAGVGHAP